MFVVWETKTLHHHQLARLTWLGRQCLLLSGDKNGEEWSKVDQMQGTL